METSSIIMLVCGIALLYGGLGFCIISAIKFKKRNKC